jgi:hypothetical protein
MPSHFWTGGQSRSVPGVVGGGESGNSSEYAYVRQGWSGSEPFIAMMKPTDLRDRYYASLLVRCDRARNRRVLVE